MTAFLDHCTVGDCGEPATTWIASRVGEAFCPSHSPTRADQTTTWATCACRPVRRRCGMTTMDDYRTTHELIWLTVENIARAARITHPAGRNYFLIEAVDALTELTNRTQGDPK